MAGHGSAIPKPPEQRRQKDRSGAVWRTLAGDGELRGPKLPDVLVEGWHPRTQQWWEVWRRSPQAQIFTETDWDFLLDTALMHHTMWSKGRWEFAAELRLRAAKYGATPEDRLRLRMTVETPDSAAVEPAPVEDVSARRRARAGLRIAAD